MVSRFDRMQSQAFLSKGYMQESLNFGLPGSYENLEACREMASNADVERTYFVTSPGRGSDGCLHITRSLSTAIELWNGAPDRRFSVAFNCSIGDESGFGSLRYGEHNVSTFISALTEAKVLEMIVQDVANKLFGRIPKLEAI